MAFDWSIASYLEESCTGQRQRGDRKGNTRNNERRYGRGQGYNRYPASSRIGTPAELRGRNRNDGRNGEGRRKAFPEPVLTEQKILQAVCKHCKKGNQNNASCRSVCQESNNTDEIKAFATRLGDSFCYFCENYRSNWRYYQLCRNRLCARGKK